MRHTVVGPNMARPFISNEMEDIILHHHDHSVRRCMGSTPDTIS